MDKIRVGIVNYLNTRPLLYGLEKLPVASQIELIGDHPANVAKLLQNRNIDLGLVPVVALKEMEEYHIVGDHCIATEGEIASVALFSEVPVYEIEKVFLDYQSRTSVALLKYLMKEYWGISPRIEEAKDENYRNELKGSTAGLVIGDRAFEQRKISTFIYDLGSEWRAITGLPFVFAVWASRRKLPEDFISTFNDANALGLRNIDKIIQTVSNELYDMKKYYTMHLSYKLDERKLRSMELFLRNI